MTEPKPQSQRTREFEERRKAKGLKKMWLWAYPETHSKIRTYAKLLTAEIEEKRNV